jgi:hypothetical protein
MQEDEIIEIEKFHEILVIQDETKRREKFNEQFKYFKKND